MKKKRLLSFKLMEENSKRGSTSNNYKASLLVRFVSFLKPHGILIFLATLAGIGRFLIPLFVPWGIKIIIDDVLGQGLWHKLHMIAGGLLALFALWTILSFIRLYLSGLVGNRIIFDLRHKLFSHLQKMPSDFFKRRKVGSLVSRMTHDITMVQQLVGHGVTATLMDVVSILAIVAIMLCVHVKLALVSFALLPFYFLITKVFSKKIRNSSKKVQEKMETLSGNLHEKFSGHALVQALCQERKEEAQFLSETQDHLESSNANYRWQALGISLAGFLAQAAPLFVIWYGATCVLSGSLSVGELVAFYAYVGLLYMPVTRLTELHVVIASSLAALERIFELLDIKPPIQEKSKALQVRKVKGSITFDQVSFSYPALPGQKESSSSCLLDRMSFEMIPGEHIAMMGLSGVGKSTIAKLMLRFYDVEGGSIRIDNIDIRKMTLASLRHHVGYVAQEPILFSGTIFENILYGNLQAKHQDVLRAARFAHAHEFILNLPQGYETQVGERGLMLSAGQKQRIAIARTLLKDPTILILDEPTSALDEMSSFVLRENLKDFRKGKTTLVITHFSSSSQYADRVIHLSEKGLDPAATIPNILENPVSTS